MNCPICDVEMKYESYGDEHGIVEYKYICPNECYYEQFAYGSTEIAIGTAIIHRYYADSKERVEIINKQIKALIKIEKEYKNKEN